MLNFRKETELAIHLLKYLSTHQNSPVSLKEISDELGISFLFLQKIARKLRAAKFIKSTQGVKGGYVLMVEENKLTLAKIVKIMEDDCVLLGCMKTKACQNYKKCSTRLGLSKLNKKIIDLMAEVKLKNL